VIERRIRFCLPFVFSGSDEEKVLYYYLVSTPTRTPSRRHCLVLHTCGVSQFLLRKITASPEPNSQQSFVLRLDSTTQIFEPAGCQMHGEVTHVLLGAGLSNVATVVTAMLRRDNSFLS
jgi:hypothetical protein